MDDNKNVTFPREKYTSYWIITNKKWIKNSTITNKPQIRSTTSTWVQESLNIRSKQHVQTQSHLKELVQLKNPIWEESFHRFFGLKWNENIRQVHEIFESHIISLILLQRQRKWKVKTDRWNTNLFSDGFVKICQLKSAKENSWQKVQKRTTCKLKNLNLCS